MHLAAMKGHTPVIEKLLIGGYQVDSTSQYPNSGWTAAHVAARQGHLEVGFLALLPLKPFNCLAEHSEQFALSRIRSKLGLASPACRRTKELKGVSNFGLGSCGTVLVQGSMQLLPTLHLYRRWELHLALFALTSFAHADEFAEHALLACRRFRGSLRLVPRYSTRARLAPQRCNVLLRAAPSQSSHTCSRHALYELPSVHELSQATSRSLLDRP